MYKKFLAFILVATFINSQCLEDKHVKLARVEAARQALNGMNNRQSRASMGTYLAASGVTGSIATLWLGAGNPELQNYVLGTCAMAVAGGLFITLTGENEQGDPVEKAKLIKIIENAQDTAQ
jgi:hypothetical protein